MSIEAPAAASVLAAFMLTTAPASAAVRPTEASPLPVASAPQLSSAAAEVVRNKLGSSWREAQVRPGPWDQILWRDMWIQAHVPEPSTNIGDR